MQKASLLFLSILLLSISCSDDSTGPDTEIKISGFRLYTYDFDENSGKWIDSSKTYIGYNVIDIEKSYSETNYLSCYGKNFLNGIYFKNLGANKTRVRFNEDSTVYEYNGDGIKTILSYDINGDLYHEEFYCIDGKPVMKTISKNNSETKRLHYFYGENGFISKIENYTVEGADSTLNSCDIYNYNNDDCLVLMELYRKNSATDEFHSTEIYYAYNHMGYVFEEDYGGTNKVFYVYDSKMLLKQVENEQGLLYEKIKYNSAGRPVEDVIYYNGIEEQKTVYVYY